MTKGEDLPRCATCAHWDEESYTWGLGVRRCMRIPQWWNATKWGSSDDDTILEWVPEAANTFAFANDGSSYSAMLLTRAEFGCVMHERKS